MRTILTIAFAALASTAHAQQINGWVNDQGAYCCGLGAIESHQAPPQFENPADFRSRRVSGSGLPDNLPDNETMRLMRRQLGD